MLKKTLIATACLVASSYAFAGGAPAPLQFYNPFSGVYLGAAIGGDHFASRQDWLINGAQVASEDGGSNIALMGQLNMGYQYGWDHWSLGGEVLYNLDSTTQKGSVVEVNSSNTTFKNRLMNKYDFGFDINGGYRWNQTLFYALTGPLWSEVQNKGSFLDPALTTTTGSQTVKKTLSAWMVGIGAEQALTDHLRLKEQFVYTIYPSTKYRMNNVFVNTVSISAFQRQSFLLGLAYQFDA